MRKAIIACAFLAGAAFGTESGSVVSSFRTPCTNGVYGIDYHDGRLFHAEGGAANVIYETTTTGSLLGTIPVGPYPAAIGIDRTDVEFWTCRYYRGLVHRLTTAGSLIRSFERSSGGDGITYGEGCLWYADSPWIYRLTVNGSVMGSFRAPSAYVYGLCWDAPYLWLSDPGTTSGSIFQITTTGSVVRSIPRPGQRPVGVTWDGKYIWYTNPADQWVYRMTVTMTGVAPASLGRVKALYR